MMAPSLHLCRDVIIQGFRVIAKSLPLSFFFLNSLFFLSGTSIFFLIIFLFSMLLKKGMYWGVSGKVSDGFS